MRQISRLLVGLMLTFLAALPMYAQQENAAFYIYQNDGHFDGFFYDEVQKISYSVLDTLGVEHDEIVSQEIVTADSIYRIMLSAIDSVGFVQPEIKMNPSLRNMREEGMNEYLATKDDETLKLTFSSSMPQNLRPRVGDVLVDFDQQDGFGGKVKSVNASGGDILVECEPLEGLRDVFHQFITVEQQDHNRQGQLIRRRTAGLPALDIDNREFLRAQRRGSDNFEATIFNFNISGKYKLVENDLLTAAVNASLTTSTKLKGSYNIPVIGDYYIGLTFQTDIDFGLGLTVDGKVSDIVDIGTEYLPSLPIPATAPIFELTGVPGLFLSGDTHIAFNGDIVKYKKRIWHKLEFNDDWLPSFNWGHQQLPELDEPIENPTARSSSLELNGSIHAGLHEPMVLGVNRWLKKFIDARFGIHMYVGPKLSGALKVSFSNMYNDQLSFYNALKDSKIALQPCAFNYEVNATTSTMFGGEKKVTIAGGSFNIMNDMEAYLFPDFQTKVDKTSEDVTITVTPQRNVIFPTRVGLGIYRFGKLERSYFNDDTPFLDERTPAYTQFSNYWKTNRNLSYKWPANFKDDPYRCLPPGKYEARPLVKFMGYVLPASPAVPFEVEGPYVSSPDTLIVLNEDNNFKAQLYMQTNCDSVGVGRLDNQNYFSNYYKGDFVESTIIKAKKLNKTLMDISLKDNARLGIKDGAVKGFEYVNDGVGLYGQAEIQGPTGDKDTIWVKNDVGYPCIVAVGDGQFEKLDVSACDIWVSGPCIVEKSGNQVTLTVEVKEDNGSYKEEKYAVVVYNRFQKTRPDDPMQMGSYIPDSVSIASVALYHKTESTDIVLDFENSDGDGNPLEVTQTIITEREARFADITLPTIFWGETHDRGYISFGYDESGVGHGREFFVGLSETSTVIRNGVETSTETKTITNPALLPQWNGFHVNPQIEAPSEE